MRILVWQWGRFGAGPRIAADFAAGFAAAGGAGVSAVLSLAADAEVLRGPHPPRNDLPVATYRSMPGFAARVAQAPVLVPALAARIAALAPDWALCAMPGPLDGLMAAALGRLRLCFAAVVHDADLHPGDGYPLQMRLQRRLLGRAAALVSLSGHVADRLKEQGFAQHRPLLAASLPPLSFAPGAAAPRAHGGPLRLLSFGRLLEYKGLDLLADALARLLPRDDLLVRVVGQGPESAALAALRRLPGVSVENRWVPEVELDDLLGWADALVLTHREASQSGVAAAALGAGRWLVSTRVGGLAEQLGGCAQARLCAAEPGAVAAEIERLFSDPPPAARGGQAMAEAAGTLVARLGRIMPGPLLLPGDRGAAVA